MAKLEAHGAQVVRMERRFDLEGGVTARTTIAVMQDGVVMKKDDYYRSGKREHGSGWKLAGVRLATEHTTTSRVVKEDATKRYAELLRSRGFQLVEAISSFV